MKQTILVIGGAGYIGSHTAYELYQHGYHVIILDALLHGHTFPHPWATFIKGDFGNKDLLRTIFQHYPIDAVMHFAAHIEVGQSVTHPLKFYSNNIANTITLLEVMRLHQCNTLIFSSSCAVYGNPQYTPLDEEHPKHPISPYGKTKLMAEEIFADCTYAYGLSYVSLRYFNAAGALHQQGLCEQHVPETHLIPLLCRAAHDQRPFFVFGIDHQTPDGSCIRDFLHVRDIAVAHIRALEYLRAGNKSVDINLGTGVGISVLEMIKIVEQLTNTHIPVTYTTARQGDPAILVADAQLAYTLLNWTPQYSDIKNIVADALASSANTQKSYYPEQQSLSQKNCN